MILSRTSACFSFAWCRTLDVMSAGQELFLLLLLSVLFFPSKIERYFCIKPVFSVGITWIICFFFQRFCLSILLTARVHTVNAQKRCARTHSSINFFQLTLIINRRSNANAFPIGRRPMWNSVVYGCANNARHTVLCLHLVHRFIDHNNNIAIRVGGTANVNVSVCGRKVISSWQRRATLPWPL